MPKLKNIKPRIQKAVRLPEGINQWSEEYAKQNEMTWTEVVVQALRDLRQKIATQSNVTSKN